MKKTLSLLLIGLLCFLPFSILMPNAYALTVDISAQYSSFVSAFNNYKQIFGQDVAIGQTVERTLSGVVEDLPAHCQWQSWAGQTYPNFDGFSIRIETVQPDYVYKIIGIGNMAGSQPSASGCVQVNSPFKIEQINYMVNHSWPSPWGTSYNRIYVNTETGRIDFSAKWYNWPALIDARAFEFAITIAKLGGTLPPFSYDTSRVQASYAYDTDAKRVVMSGGRTWNTSDFRSDIWTLDPITSKWTAVSTSSGPEGRFAASMSYNPLAKNFLIFGGSTLSGPPPSGEVSDTWVFQFTGPYTGAWTQILAMGPSARRSAPLIFDSKNALFVLFGGEQYVYSLGDTWVFDPSSSAWINKNPSPAPPQRARAAMAFDAQSGKVLLFGGLNKGAGTLLSDTWLYDGSANIWQQVVTATAPSARQFPSLACEGNGVFYLFGGWRVDAGGGLGQYLDDTWKFDMATMQWTQLLPSQSPIAQSQAALMHIGSGRFVLINGWRDSPLGEVWVYDSSQNTWTTEMPPRFRFPILEELNRQFRLAVSDATSASLFNILEGTDVGDRMMADLTDEALQEIIRLGFAKFFLDRINADLPPELKIRSIRQLPVDTQLEIEAISKVISEVGTEPILRRFFREIDFTERALVGFASASPLTLQLVSPEGLTQLYNQLAADFEDSLREIEEEWLRLGQPIIDPSQAFFLLNTYRSDISRSTGRTGQLALHASVTTLGELGHVTRVIQWFDSDIRQLIETALFALKIAAIFDVKAKVGTFIASLGKVAGLISVYNFLLQVIINENHLLRRSIVDIGSTIIELLHNPDLYRLNPGTVLSLSFQEITAIRNRQIGIVKYEYSWPIDSFVFVSAGFYSPEDELLFWTHSQIEFHSPGETAGYTLRYSFPGIIYSLQFDEMVVRIFVHNVDASGERNFLLGPIVTTIPVKIF